MPEKDKSEPSLMVAVANGLSVAPNPKISVWERVGPAIFGGLYLIGLAVVVFFDVPNKEAYLTFMAVVGPPGSAWIGKLGASNR